MLTDFAYALRLLGRSPGFTVAVVLSLGLGIGANTAIFTLMDAVMWRMLPVQDPEHLLVAALQQGTDIGGGFNYDDYKILRDASTMARSAGYATAPVNVSVDGRPEASVQGQLVSGDYFSLLGVNPVIGRAIGPDDDRVPNGHPVVMLSHGYWERRFARDPGVLGRTIRLSDTPFTIVAVTPPEFFGVEVGTAPDIFVPLMMQPTVMPAFENLLQNPIVNRTWVNVIARTKPGFTPDQAAAAMDAALQSGQDPRRSAPKTAGEPGPPPARLVLSPATSLSDLRRQFSRPLFVLLAMVGVVLLTACANTANLLLARAAARRPEFAMRLALGAGRSRLMRQLLVESVVLAALGGVCGLVVARWTTQMLVAFMSSGRTAIALDLAPNPRILMFTAAVSIATGILFGLAPAWRATRIDLTPALKNVRSSLTRGLRPGRILSIAQLALSLLLLVGAGLFVRSLQNLNGNATDAFRQSVSDPPSRAARQRPAQHSRDDGTARSNVSRADPASAGDPERPPREYGERHADRADVDRRCGGANGIWRRRPRAAPDGVSELLRDDWNPDSEGTRLRYGRLDRTCPGRLHRQRVIRATGVPQ